MVVQESASGLPSLTVGGISFHSRMDPWAEAVQFAKKADVKGIVNQGAAPVVFGFGMGYHIQAILEEIDFIYVIEPKAWIIKAAFSYRDFRDVISRIGFVCGRSVNSFQFPSVLIPHPPSVRQSRACFDYWSGIIPSPGVVRKKTAGELADSLERFDGLKQLLGTEDPDKKISQSELAEKVLGGKGRLLKGEVYMLLLQELAPLDRKNRS